MYVDAGPYSTGQPVAFLRWQAYRGSSLFWRRRSQGKSVHVRLRKKSNMSDFAARLVRVPTRDALNCAPPYPQKEGRRREDTRCSGHVWHHSLKQKT